ncbi:CGNR zinc finger domain-containing protein [Defluviimonas aestuarii]|uniref:CGNR zinc finger domain-containing protein n=1 Tax=Albidovulum aestuarii TaxID=1130726 RepID=UPI00249BDEF7|nr:CGNR zinc finger domain-containing protein [Defluviimonas aestuarii]MDI3337432.1 CGNR zinc finger domain-containing protein [Defluviimonas aestuarii]
MDWTEGDFIGGHPVLDFLNTAAGRTKQRDVERLVDFETFLKWSCVAGIVSESEVNALTDRLHRDPTGAGTALSDVCRFREALHGCLIAEQAGSEWPEDAKALVISNLRDCLAKAQLAKCAASYEWSVSACETDLALPLTRLVLETEALLRSDDLARMRCCDRCSWLFIDRGRGPSRRWCSMAACGSRAKSARYYQRKTGNGDER